MRNMQFIGHQLVGVLAVRLAQMFVQHDSVYDGQDRVDTINTQQKKILDITGGGDKPAENEQDDKSNTDRRSGHSAPPGESARPANTPR